MKVKKKFIFILVFVLISVVVVTGINRSRNESLSADQELIEEDYIPVEVESIKKDTIANQISLNGKVFANEELMVMPLIPGNIVKVNVSTGDYVKKGDVLFIVDQDDVLRGIEQAQNSVDLAESGVEQAEIAMKSAEINYKTVKANVDNALLNLKRSKALYEAGALSKSQLEQAEMAASTRPIEVAEAQVKQAEISYEQSLSQLSQAKIGYEQANSNLSNSVITAPINGLISNVNAIEGQFASNAQSVATIIDIEQVYIQVDVAENTINRLSMGQEVTVTVPSAVEGELTGRIDYISPASDPKTQLYKVKVNLSNKDNKIKPGMSGSVILDIESREDVLSVRNKAIIDSDGTKFVYVVKDDKAVKQEIALGLDTGSYIEVEEGLEEGDIVIIKGQNYVVEGQTVKVVRGE